MINERTNEDQLAALEIEDLETVIAPGGIESD